MNNDMNNNIYVGDPLSGIGSGGGGAGIPYQDVHSIELDRARKENERLQVELKIQTANVDMLKDVIRQIISGIASRY